MNQMEWIQAAISAAFGLGGVAVGYGYLRARVSNLAENQNDHAKRILSLENRGIHLMFRENCKEVRDECHGNLCAKFEEVKDEIKNNRLLVMEKFDEISQFMGFVKAIIETKVK